MLNLLSAHPYAVNNSAQTHCRPESLNRCPDKSETKTLGVLPGHGGQPQCEEAFMTDAEQKRMLRFLRTVECLFSENIALKVAEGMVFSVRILLI